MPKGLQLDDFLVLNFERCHPYPVVFFLQIDEVREYYIPKKSGSHRLGMKAPLICSFCRGWFEGEDACPSCRFDCREVQISWTYWLTAVLIQVHNILRSTFRERRGVVKLLGVPPAIGFALLNYFARPEPAVNRRVVYGKDHPSYFQGSSKGKTYHLIRFAYDCMAHVKWAFPLHEKFPKTSQDSARLVTRGRFSDVRLFGTPVQFKYLWQVQRKLGSVVTEGNHVFTVSANITHIGLATGLPRWNVEYGRWVVEQQTEHIDAVKSAVKSFPARPLRRTHKLAGLVHPLNAWADEPTVVKAGIGVFDAVADAVADGVADAVADSEEHSDYVDDVEEFSELSDDLSDTQD